MHAVRIKRMVTQEGIMIPFNTLQQFQGKRVDIIILPDVESESSSSDAHSLRTALADLFEQYQDVEPYQQIEPLQWERAIRNEW